MKHIQPFEPCDSTPKRYDAYLLGQVEWANNILAAPCVKYPNGRLSHDAAREVLCEAQCALLDHRMEYGRYTPTEQGMRFAGY